MAASLISLSELKPGRCTQTVVARVLRFWEARNVKKDGEIMGVDMLQLDDKSSLIQASISVHRLNTFRELLREGAMYELSGFDVVRSNKQFKLCDSDVAIRLNEFTKMVEVPVVANPIPTEMFRFRSVDQLMSLANTNVELPDIIGEVSDIRTTYNDHTQTTQRVMINIRAANNATVCVSVFDSVAEVLHKRLEAGVVQPKVLVATNINPKFVGGRLYLNATSGTHFYFDNEVAASQSLFEELSSKPDSGATSGKQYRGVKKLEPVTLGELNKYVLESPPQDIEFLCKAKIGSFETTNGWCYIACAKCSKKLQRGISSFTCPTCFNTSAVGVVRYRVEMLVDSGEDAALFIAFDSAISRLTGVRAAEVAHPMGQDGQEPEGYQLPQFLQDIVGNTYIFHLKLTEFNFTGNHKSFTVARIFDPNDKIPGPSFAPQGVGHSLNDNKHGKNCGSSKIHVGASSGSDPADGGDGLKEPSGVDAKEAITSSEPKENPPKKPRHA